ncbi:hypothetical protein EIN_134590 [Entamoeba invadens IP1]|uniref:Uncharacterized protein n=1 Tax=Entamoeba invadens IP1 TaxID=370355 RepID=A0A0A1TX72_ENTIV|nr:hypothetical protein EIN_134590 [Entamoeba invadens IP1]ELP85905.1 hypothetical protein EIN_134590 [Entamoeba invadens IP1]|eukprot:XP_004185251.1 hypothetical protein EIN_134590 [Entamoeba invadens IP1]
MQQFPLHPFVEYPVQLYINVEKKNQPFFSKDMFENIMSSPITPRVSKKLNEESKPFKSDSNSEKRYPKIRVSLKVFEKLKRIQSEKKFKSFCEVVSRLLGSYEETHLSSIVKSE